MFKIAAPQPQLVLCRARDSANRYRLRRAVPHDLIRPGGPVLAVSITRGPKIEVPRQAIGSP